MKKGQLSKEGIERMVKEAEKHMAEDKAAASRISAKNGLESLHAYNLRNTLTAIKASLRLPPTSPLLGWIFRERHRRYESRQMELEGVARYAHFLFR